MWDSRSLAELNECAARRINEQRARMLLAYLDAAGLNPTEREKIEKAVRLISEEDLCPSCRRTAARERC